jgi:hypothetical protein
MPPEVEERYRQSNLSADIFQISAVFGSWRCCRHTLKTAKGAKRELAKKWQRENFDQILLDAIDEALSSLGENVKRTVYFQLEALFKIGKQDIPIRLSDFSNALEQLFGLGATHLELLFMKNLHDKIGVTFKWPEYERPSSKWIVP